MVMRTKLRNITEPAGGKGNEIEGGEKRKKRKL